MKTLSHNEKMLMVAQHIEGEKQNAKFHLCYDHSFVQIITSHGHQMKGKGKYPTSHMPQDVKGMTGDFTLFFDHDYCYISICMAN